MTQIKTISVHQLFDWSQDKYHKPHIIDVTLGAPNPSSYIPKTILFNMNQFETSIADGDDVPAINGRKY
jgi:hypothetical protein